MNIEKLCSIGAIEEEPCEAVLFCRANGRADEIVKKHFQIIDELGDCRKFFFLTFCIYCIIIYNTIYTKEVFPMVIAIREGSDIPIYQQIRDQIVQGISDGRLSAGEQLPTVRALAEEIGINSMTVNKAYQLLKQQGYIIADRRNGARISKEIEKSSQLSKESKELLKRIIAEAKISGITEEEFLDECRRYYTGTGEENKQYTKLWEGDKNSNNISDLNSTGNISNSGRKHWV